MPSKAERGDLRALLARTLGVTQRRVYQMAKELADRASVSTADAIWIIAAQNRINLTQYLPPEVVDRVRLLRQQVPAPPRRATPPDRQTRTVPTRAPKQLRAVPKEFRGEDPILDSATMNKATEMAATYPLLCLVENSMREFIRRVIESRHGKKWWDDGAPEGIRKTIRKRKSEDEKNAWHQRRGKHPIDYLDLNQLPALVRKELGDFVPDLLPSIEWFQELVNELYLSRCVVCHMNPLHKDNIQGVKSKVRQWQKQVKGKEASGFLP